MPQFSVVTSVHNGENYLKECINSILDQTFKDFEYIILNNGSTDRTAEILAQYTDPRIRIIHQENLGVVNSLNKAVSLCRSDLIARLDADDYVHPDWLEKHYAYMNQNPDVVLCSSRFEEFKNGKIYPQSFPFIENDLEIRKSLSFMNPIAHSLSVIRKPSILKVGGYDPKLIIAHDYDLWIRLLKEGKGHNLNETLGVHRSHDDSYSMKKERTMIKEAFKVQWRAYTRLGGSFWKMLRSLSRRATSWCLPARMRSYFRTNIRK
ncbi:glycosyltransferase [Nitrospinae bacterium]|nr:glycosyltransferase [Nitrospinota bacterium]